MAQKTDIIRIALIGPESTAKSKLSVGLAKYYKTIGIPEYARNYLKNREKNYTLDDILIISKAQLNMEQQSLSKANTFIFADTELIISKVWCEDVFKTCPEWISENSIKNKYDLYLLTYPDLQWKQDVLRENPHRRQFFFDWYERELKNINAHYVIIKGEGAARLKNCIEAIDLIYNKQIILKNNDSNN